MIDGEAGMERINQNPLCLWFTGLPGAGKSTIAELLERRLAAEGRRVCVLDGDALRRGLNADLGFSAADRRENIRRTAEVARLFVDAGLVAVVALISPFEADRAWARRRFGPGEFIEVFIDAPLAVCERRDPKGLYARARRGELANLTGVGSGYEAPFAPEIRLDTVAHGPEACVERIVSALHGQGQAQGDAGAPPGLARDLNLAPVQQHDAVHDRQAQPRAARSPRP